MARGFLSGVLWGGVVSIGVAGVVSVLAPLPMPPEVGDAAPGAAQAPDSTAPVAGATQASRDSDAAPDSSQPVPQAAAPAPDALQLGADVTTPAGQPETGAADGLQTPVAAGDVTQTAPEAEEPVLPNPQALAPMAPQPVEELSISTEPAQPPAPEVAEIEGAFDNPEMPQAPEAEPELAGEPQSEIAVAPVTEAPAEAAIEPAAPDAPDAPQVDAPVVAEVPSEAEATPEAVPLPDVAERDTDSTRPAIGTPAVRLTDRSSGVAVNRLTTGSTTVEVAEEAVVEETPAAEKDPRPLVENSVTFEGGSDKPLMAVVLIDDGTSVTAGAAGLAALRSFPYPLSFAVDSALPDAAQRVETYRAAGFEVLVMIDLPEGAQPSDAETAFGVTLDKIDGVVGVLEGTRGGFQGSRDVSDQVTEILARSGHGLVTQDKGLNTMPKLARKAGVPADPVFRDFDSKDQSATVIRRFLDQAAFKAGQEGAVIMLGRLRPDTVSALLLWGLQDRAGQVALAPVSTVLLRAE